MFVFKYVVFYLKEWILLKNNWEKTKCEVTVCKMVVQCVDNQGFFGFCRQKTVVKAHGGQLR